MKSLGLVTDGFGSPDPSAKRGEKMTAGLIPGRYFYQEIGAATGLTKALREQGVIKADLDLEGFINEILFGRNAGKPLTKIEQELASMAQSGEVNADKAKLAIAAIKEGNWTPEALAALDRVQGENAGRRLLSQIGFQSIVTNTPRSELANKLYKGMGAVGGDAGRGRYEVDPATGKKTYVEGAASKFYRDNPGAGVLASKNDSAADIRQGLADDQTRAAMNDLYAKQRDKKISARDFNLAVEKLSGQNPAYFEKYPLKQDAGDRRYSEQYDQYNQIGGAKYDALSEQVQSLMKGTAADKKAAYSIMNSREYKDAQTARNLFLKNNPDFFSRYKEGIEKKTGKPYTQKSDAERDYSEKQGAYSNIGGDRYDMMQEQVQTLMNSGDAGKKAAYAIMNSREYKQTQAAREQFMRDNPDFARQYQDEQRRKAAERGETYKAPKSEGDKIYSEKQSSYFAIGGDKYEQMNQRQQELRAAGRTKEANAIYNSAEYKRVKSAREQFMLDNPDFAQRYKQEQKDKYGKQEEKPQQQAKASYSSGGGNNRTYPQSSGARKTTSTYPRSAQPVTKRAGSYNSAKPVSRSIPNNNNAGRLPAQYNRPQYQNGVGGNNAKFYSGQRPTGTGRITNNLPAPTPAKFNAQGRRILNDKELRQVLSRGIDPNEFLSYTSNRDIGELIALNKRAVNSLPRPSTLTANTFSKSKTSKGKKPKWKKTPPRR